MGYKNKIKKIEVLISTSQYQKQLLSLCCVLSIISILYTIRESYQLFQMNRGISDAKVIVQEYNASSTMTNYNENGTITGVAGSAIANVAGQAINNVANMAMTNVLSEAIKARNWKLVKVLISFITAILSLYLIFLMVTGEKIKMIFKK